MGDLALVLEEHYPASVAQRLAERKRSRERRHLR
jgi:hypothetical protein